MKWNTVKLAKMIVRLHFMHTQIVTIILFIFIFIVINVDFFFVYSIVVVRSLIQP